MKKSFVLFLVAILFSAGVVAQTQVLSKVEKATVYLNGATLTHTATATLKSGSQEVIINGLSPNIVLNSLKVNAGGVLIASTEFSTDYLTLQEESAHINKMKDSLKLYKQKLSDAINDLDSYEHLLKLLKEGTLHNMQQTQQTVSVADINANMELYKAKAGALQKSIDENDSKIANLRETIQRLERQIRQDQTKDRHRHGVLRLSVSVPKAITTEFTITYFTEMASWTPCYDLNIHDMEQQVTLQAKAQVQQRTGLDWNHVQLTLSNATPNRTTEAPVFSTWFLSFYYPTYGSRMNKMQNTVSYATAAKVQSNETSEENVEYMDEMAEEIPAPMIMNDYVDVDMQEVHVNYVISLPYDIPGNGKIQLIDLKDYTINADYKYYSIPKLSDETYLIATLSGYEQHNLLPGYATVTFNNTFVGKTLINPNVADSLFSVTLATDPRITVKREKQQQYCETKHVGNSTTVTQSYLITVKNNQNKEVKLTLKEQYPISTNKDIEVKVPNITPTATYNKSDIGVVTWDVNLKAGETRTFSITYSVKHPKDRSISW
ncbi:MAG: mucoidy inhibitor MuiA family protein [Bacteroidales bacterium]|nr:mucoidy inhibitor MuiA family protein [Bacteroidales bacterium]